MVSPQFLTLTFHIQSDWHLGSGREGGAYADNLVAKTHSGLPILHGKSIKGLLRHACQQALEYEWVKGATQELVSQLFGTEDQGLAGQGLLRVDSATLSPAEAQWFEQHAEHKKHLFRVLFSTAINHQRGTAETGSLRSMEVAVPLTLSADIGIYPQNATQAEIFPQLITAAVPLITAVGAKRRRGFGEAFVTIKPKEAA